jgi:hypothetical protein
MPGEPGAVAVDSDGVPDAAGDSGEIDGAFRDVVDAILDGGGDISGINGDIRDAGDDDLETVADDSFTGDGIRDADGLVLGVLDDLATLIEDISGVGDDISRIDEDPRNVAEVFPDVGDGLRSVVRVFANLVGVFPDIVDDLLDLVEDVLDIDVDVLAVEEDVAGRDQPAFDRAARSRQAGSVIPNVAQSTPYQLWRPRSRMPRRFITFEDAVFAGSQTASSSGAFRVSKAKAAMASAASEARPRPHWSRRRRQPISSGKVRSGSALTSWRRFWMQPEPTTSPVATSMNVHHE